VICAYTMDRLPWLREAIDSVRNQTLAAEEIVLVVDHLPDLLAEGRRSWPGIRVLPNRHVRGLSGARNSGWSECTGDVVAFLDDDAVAPPQWLERLLSAYESDRVVGVGGAVRPRWLEGRPGWFPSEFDWVVGCTHSGLPSTRTPVRNLVGANMSFRRRLLVELGGFRRELSRVGKTPVGGEETDLCIRIAQRWPRALVVYDPAISVDHAVPGDRARFRYFRSRCAAEGRSKAVLARLVGAESGLASERVYVRQTLPAGIRRGLGEALRGDLGGAARAGAIALGLLFTSAGYARGRVLPGRPVPYDQFAWATQARPRILMVTPRNPLGQGGVERHVIEVSRRVAAKAEVEVLCAEPGGPAVTEQQRDGVIIRSVRAWPAKSDYCFAPRIWREMTRKPWDLVHVQSYHTLVAPLAMLRALMLGIPYVLTFHGGGHSQRLRSRLRRAQRLALRPLLARAERLVAVARFEIDLYARELKLPRERFTLIPNGTDPVAMDPALGNHAGEPGLLASIGRLERYKGHHRVIDALPHVLERRPEARLLVVGSGPYEAALRRHAAERGVADRVEVTSVPAEDRRAMAMLLQRISLVVLLSDFETHPLAGLEAAAAGRRLLVATSGGLAELAEDGLARGVSPDATPAEVAQAIVEELARPIDGQRPNLPSWEDCADALLALYGSIALGSTPGAESVPKST
jgi:glycosyltransferase involved in cell wall biosynthesis/GT2 family glycosyltransferase